jgi:hypothetical protein
VTTPARSAAQNADRGPGGINATDYGNDFNVGDTCAFEIPGSGVIPEFPLMPLGPLAAVALAIGFLERRRIRRLG